MTRRPFRRPQRRRVFLGCEGESERAYGALLARFVETHHQRVHLDTVLLQPGSGDPLALVERAVVKIQRRSSRDPYAARAILLDSDKLSLVLARDAKIEPLARRHAIQLIWQQPCHEAVLLRHLEGCEMLRPDDCERAGQELLRRWPQYEKGIPALRLALRIDEIGVLRAAGVEPGLLDFLAEIEFGLA